ncbi:MAG: hypothetical protein A49_11810 [Methyloceanibacter sp.]|nr:MAG: hypothetical protein A49_11810 [Methyloceanibacter sp.]
MASHLWLSAKEKLSEEFNLAPAPDVESIAAAVLDLLEEPPPGWRHQRSRSSSLNCMTL